MSKRHPRKDKKKSRQHTKDEPVLVNIGKYTPSAAEIHSDGTMIYLLHPTGLNRKQRRKHGLY